MSKKEQATAIFIEMFDETQDHKTVRKNIIDRFIADVDMTPAGASTYFANIKKGLYGQTTVSTTTVPTTTPAPSGYREHNNNDDRRLFTVVYRGVTQKQRDGDVIHRTSSHFNEEAARAELKRSKKKGVVVNGVLSDDDMELKYSQIEKRGI